MWKIKFTFKLLKKGLSHLAIFQNHAAKAEKGFEAVSTKRFLLNYTYKKMKKKYFRLIRTGNLSSSRIF